MQFVTGVTLQGGLLEHVVTIVFINMFQCNLRSTSVPALARHCELVRVGAQGLFSATVPAQPGAVERLSNPKSKHHI